MTIISIFYTTRMVSFRIKELLAFNLCFYWATSSHHERRLARQPSRFSIEQDCLYLVKVKN